jgi:hypothetical protein
MIDGSRGYGFASYSGTSTTVGTPTVIPAHTQKTKTTMKSKLMIIIALASAIASTSAQQSQSQAQYFVVTAKDVPKGVEVLVKERDTGKEVFGVIRDIHIDGDLDRARKVALFTLSEFSGPGKPIASGGFHIKTWDNTLSKDGHGYVTVVERLRPEGIQPLRRPDQIAEAQRMSASAAWADEHKSSFVRDDSLPQDTVRLRAKVKPGPLLPAKPKAPLGGTITVKVIDSNGKQVGWMSMSEAQAAELHRRKALPAATTTKRSNQDKLRRVALTPPSTTEPFPISQRGYAGGPKS